jgi:DNA-binding MarR family transcriptional regulator
VDEELRRDLDESPLLRLVAFAGQVARQRWVRVLNEQHGMTPSGVSALLMLAWGGRPGGAVTGTPGRATHAELARRMWVRPATVTGIIDTLERAGIVRRERDESDRRVVWLTLTEAGEDRAREIGKQMREEFGDPVLPRDPAHEPIIRAFLIDLITTYSDDKEE